MERYLCIGGTEISDPCRTVAYMRNVGNACSTGSAPADCCCCADQSTSVESFGFDITQASGPAEGGLHFVVAGDISLMVASYGWTQSVGVGIAPGAVCPGPPPPPPLDSDLGWSVAPLGVALSTLLGVGADFTPPGPGDPIICTLSRLILTIDGADIGSLYGHFDSGTGETYMAWRAVAAAVGDWYRLDTGGTLSVVGGGSSSWAGTGVAGFTDPVTDDAPWYDAADPRSGDVLGVWLDEMTLSSPHRRTAGDKLWGGTLGPSRLGRRELHLKGKVYVKNRAAAEYARQWLYEALVDSPCGESGCDPPDAELVSYCGTSADDTGTRTLHEVGLIDWQWQLDTTAPYHCFADFQATLSSRVPWLTKAPVVAHSGFVIPGDVSPICDFCGDATASGTPCAAVPDASGDLLCGCAAQPARAVDTPQRSECYTRPTSLVRHSFAITSAKLWTDGALRFTIVGGLGGDPAEPSLRNLRLRAWANPLGLSLGEADTLLCSTDPCVDVQIGCVPYGATMTIDGSTHRATVSAGQQARSANPYLSSGSGHFRWPDYSCGGMIVTVDADAITTAVDSTIAVETIEVERG